MRRIWIAAAAWALSPLASLAYAAGTVEVSFNEPEKFTDAGRGSFDREHTLKGVGEALKALGPQLPDGQTLRLEVLDIDLAGELRPTRSGAEVRVLRGRADWPQITVRYTLMGDGRTLKAGEDRLADLNYLWMTARLRTNEEFVYERRMLSRWFGETFTATKN